MNHLVPRGTWRAGGTVLVLLVIVLPQLAVTVATPGLRSLAALAAVATTTTFVAVLGAAVVFYLHWRLTGSDHSAWLSALGTVLGLHGLVVVFLYATRPAGASDHPWWLIGSDLSAGLLVLAVVLVSRRLVLTKHPALVAMLVGTGTSLVLLVVADLTPSGPMPASAHVASTVVLVAVGAGTALLVRRCRTMPRRTREPIALACFLLLTSRAVFCPDSGSNLAHLIVILTGVAGSTVLCATAFGLVREALRDEHDSLVALRAQVDAIQAAAEAAEERLHEVRGTVAGIASACHLIRVADRMPADRRQVLEEMLDAESQRLQRLMHGDTTAAQPSADPAVDAADPMLDELLPIPWAESEPEPDPEPTAEPAGPHDVELDALLHPLVVARRVSGHRVSWVPSGLRAWCRPDELATVVNILLDNAVQHAPGSLVTISATRTAAEVQIRVKDQGPGIDESVRALLFDRGRKGVRSGGSGIGMHMAAQLARAAGSTLELEETGPYGTTFVVRIRRTTLGVPPVGAADGDSAYEQGPDAMASGSPSSPFSYATS